MGRIARWASARDFDALIVINEDRKVASASAARFVPDVASWRGR
jgi:hypothetical protein